MSGVAFHHYRCFPGNRDETHCDFVSSRGLLNSCRHRRRRPRSGSNKLPPVRNGGIRANDSIYVCAEALDAFVDQILPRARNPFVLVSGDSTVGINECNIRPATLRAILDNPYLKSWYAQNLTKTHEKQHHMPLGLDFHTLAHHTEHQWGAFLTPVDQEKELVGTACAAPPIAEKMPLGYCNWQFEMNRGTREACMARIDEHAMFFEPMPVPRAQSWATNAKMLFTISPTGVGTDCHRTWEAIALGTIPVIDRSELSPLFATLPVIEVEDWSVVTVQFLREKADEMVRREYDFAPMFLRHWANRIAGRPGPSLVMSIPEFVERGIEKAREIL